jgi:hypothetical protein
MGWIIRLIESAMPGLISSLEIRRHRLPLYLVALRFGMLSILLKYSKDKRIL